MFLQGEAVPAQEASLQRSDVAEERVGSLNGLDYRNSMCPEFSVNDHTSHERHHTQAGGMRMVYPALVVARSTKDASDGFVGHAVSSGNLAQGFVVLNDTAYCVWPFGSGYTVCWVLWP